MSTRQLALLIFAVTVTTAAVLLLLLGVFQHRNHNPTMVGNGLDVTCAGAWILWSTSRLRAHVDTVEHEIRTDVVYAARGLHKVAD
jgi:ABC-type nickel/cobalt efflux system permease component RcnA